MIWKPYEHVQPLIDEKVITEAQWYLFALADEYLQREDRVSSSVMLKFRGLHVQAYSIGLDSHLPGVLLIRSAGGSMVYAPWSDLVLVTVQEEHR